MLFSFIKPLSKISGDINNENVTSNKDSEVDVDFSFFLKDEAKYVLNDTVKDAPQKKKTSKPRVKVIDDDTTMVNPIPGANVAETDYAGTYTETSRMLREAIAQADELNYEIKEDIESVRSSKTIKNKYTYITNLTASAGALISTKINAIKEINSSITQSHNLELNRMKALKLDKANENDDMKMMDIYSAFVNTPIGTYTPPAPSIQDITIGVNSPNSNVGTVEMVNTNGTNSNNLTPEQNRMRMESNPNIDVVVKYNQATGQRYFDVIDKSNGMSVPNYPRPDAFLLEDTTIDIHSRIARNRNINTVWPLIVEGSFDNINEY